MIRGREIYGILAQKSEDRVLDAIAGLKGRDLAALIHYTEGLEPGEERDVVTGTALIVAAGRYLARVRKKAAKKARRAKTIL